MDGYLAHPNNYLSQSMHSIESEPENLVNSRVHYFHALELLKRTLPAHQ
jgi:hypothetical protein